MMLSGIEKKAFEQGIVIGSEEKAREIYENLLKLGVAKEILNQAIYNNQPPNDDPAVD